MSLYGSGDTPENNPDDNLKNPEEKKSFWEKHKKHVLGAFITVLVISAVVALVIFIISLTAVAADTAGIISLDDIIYVKMSKYCDLVAATDGYDDADCPESMTMKSRLTVTKERMGNNPGATPEVLNTMKALINKMKEGREEKKLKELDIEVTLLMAGLDVKDKDTITSIIEQYTIKSRSTTADTATTAKVSKSVPKLQVTVTKDMTVDQKRELKTKQLGRPVVQFDVDASRMKRDTAKEDAKIRKEKANAFKNLAEEKKLAAASATPADAKKLRSEARAARAEARTARKAARAEISRAFAAEQRAKINANLVDPDNNPLPAPELTEDEAKNLETALKSDIGMVLKEFDEDTNKFDELLALASKPTLAVADTAKLQSVLTEVEQLIPIDETPENIATVEQVALASPPDIAAVISAAGLAGHRGKWVIEDPNGTSKGVEFEIAGEAPHKIKVHGMKSFQNLTKSGDYYIMDMSTVKELGNPNIQYKLTPVGKKLMMTIVQNGTEGDELEIYRSGHQTDHDLVGFWESSSGVDLEMFIRKVDNKLVTVFSPNLDEPVFPLIKQGSNYKINDPGQGSAIIEKISKDQFKITVYTLNDEIEMQDTMNIVFRVNTVAELNQKMNEAQAQDSSDSVSDTFTTRERYGSIRY